MQRKEILGEGERVTLRFIQISDLHIKEHRNLLEPMIDQINREQVDLVVVTGDTVQYPKKELFDVATSCLNKIIHKVVILPGECDGGELWVKNFGDRFKSLDLNGYCLEFLDTTFLKHRFAVGWGDVMKNEDSEQYEWLKDRLKIDKYHLIFSHHPFWTKVNEDQEKHELLSDNVRAIYSGHLHETNKFYFKYEKPRRTFSNGFATVSIKFHGNSSYLMVIVKSSDEIVNISRVVGAKKTAW